MPSREQVTSNSGHCVANEIMTYGGPSTSRGEESTLWIACYVEVGIFRLTDVPRSTRALVIPQLEGRSQSSSDRRKLNPRLANGSLLQMSALR